MLTGTNIRLDLKAWCIAIIGMIATGFSYYLFAEITRANDLHDKDLNAHPPLRIESVKQAARINEIKNDLVDIKADVNSLDTKVDANNVLLRQILQQMKRD